MSSPALLIVQEGGAVDRYDLTPLLLGSHDPSELTVEHLMMTTSKVSKVTSLNCEIQAPQQADHNLIMIYCKNRKIILQEKHLAVQILNEP